MRPRKTINVADVVDMANAMLADSIPELDRERSAIASLLERVLLETDNYRGFGYTRDQYLPAAEQTDEKVLRDGYDPTRRQYFRAVTS